MVGYTNITLNALKWKWSHLASLGLKGLIMPLYWVCQQIK